MCCKLLCLLGLLTVPLFCGCSGKVVFGVMPTPSPTPLITVLVSPSSANVNGMKSQLFTAIVTGTANPAVTWSIAGPGCDGLSCGSIAANGVYKAPPTAPNPATVTVTATSNADRAKFATASVTLLPASPATVAVTPKTATVLAGKTVNLAALVTNTPNTAVAWSVAGAGCSGVTCGTISSGVYTAPPAAPSPAAVIVTATSESDPTKADQAVISIVDSPGGLITGTFIYLLNGFDSAGGISAVGSITFHSDGTFIASEDESFSSGAASSDIWSGTYTIGSDGRGAITGSGLLIGTRTLQFSVLPGDEVRFVQFNSAGMRSSGVMRRVNSAVFTLAGDWALEFTGVDRAGSPMGMTGNLQLKASGNITGSFALDTGNGLTQGQLTGNYGPPSAGRSSVQLAGPGQTLNWVFYIVSENEMFWLVNGSRDPLITQLSGRALRRTGAPFTAQSLDAATVLSLTGNGWLSLGALSFDGAISASGTIDQKTTFFSVVLNSSAKAEYSVDSVDGCGSLTLHSLADTQQFSICLIGHNHAFVLQTTGPTAAQAYIGEIEPQVANASADLLDGTYNFGSERPGNSHLGLAAGTFTSSAAVVNGTADITLPSSDAQAQTVAGSITSFYPSTGRGTATLNLPGFSTTVFYVVSNGRVLFLPMATGSPGIEAIVSVLSSGR
jgi:hypothetical protein